MIGDVCFIVMVGGCIGAWKSSEGGIVSSVPIEGEKKVALKNLDFSLSAISDRLASDGSNIVRIDFIVDRGNFGQFTKPIRDYCAIFYRMGSEAVCQVLSWELLSADHKLADNPWDNLADIESILSSLLRANNSSAELSSTPKPKEERQIERDLEEEVRRLRVEIGRLQAQKEALKVHDVERMATYLPALYHNFFELVSPSDLALLCGRLEPPAVSSPFVEPSPETLRRMQRDFRLLPEAVREEIIHFARSLPQASRLRARPEMRELLDNWGASDDR